MRFIITAQSSSEKATTEQPTGFDEALFKSYMRFNEEMHQAGVLVASEGLNPAAPGARIAVAQGKRHVVDGPFAESKELIGGFYLLEVDSLDEAVQWALRAPSGFGKDDILEVRQLTGAGDLPPEILKLINESAPNWSAAVWQSRGASRKQPTTGTVRLHRILKASPERVYRAFLEPDALAKWVPPFGFTCQVHELDARVGGSHRMSFRNFTTGNAHSFGGEYLELVPFEKIRYTDRFDDPNLPGEITVSITLRKVICGVELTIVQEGIPEVIPVEMCHLGWQESLAQLARLVEPEIPD